MSKHATQLSVLIAKKEQYFKRIQNLYDLIKKLGDKTSISYFRKRYETLNETKTHLIETIESINYLQLECNSDFTPDFSTLDAIDDLICEIEYAKKGLDNANKPGTSVPSTSSLVVKLPKLELVAFSGELKDWPIFHETFKKAIHENKDLTDADKIQYLVGKLSGHALNAISGIPATHDNYSLIWQALCDKYNDKRKLALFYVTQMFNFKSIQTESSNHLDMFIEKFVNSYHALKQMNIINLADFLILYLASTKVDSDTYRNFEMSDHIRGKDFPLFDEFVQFIKEQSKILERLNSHVNKEKGKSTSAVKVFSEPKNKHLFFTENIKPFKQLNETCSCCKKEKHQIYICKEFIALSPQDRFKFVKHEGRCFNCLSNLHKLYDCKSKSSCNVCTRRHHSLIHLNKVGETSEQASTSVNLCNVTKNYSSSVLLSTAVVNVVSHIGKTHSIRILLDSGSQTNLITESCRKSLGLKKEKIFSSIQGIGHSSTKVLAKTTLAFSPHFNLKSVFTAQCYVVDKITDNLPTAQIDVNGLPHLRNLILADKSYATPGPVDAIIGAELYAYLLGTSKISNEDGSCIALDTRLGYIVMGKAPVFQQHEQDKLCYFQSEPLEELVNKFWSLEEIHTNKSMSEEDEDCEVMYAATIHRETSGRYVVNLPFKEPTSVLGNSLETAVRRFNFLEKRFRKNPEFKLSYCSEIEKMINSGYISLTEGEDGYFIPHHGVFKQDSSSTPLRIVYDGSAKSSSGYSLNDILHVGPKLHTDSFSILLRFRLFQVAMISDVRQMYLRILVTPEHRKFQKIVWRFNETDSLQFYHLNVVTFGIKSSPYLAIRTVKQLAMDEKLNFPHAAARIDDMYVDDLVTSVSTSSEAIALFQEFVGLFRSGSFDLVKWSTNSTQFMEHIPSDYRKMSTVTFDPDNKSKVLGLIWNPQTDAFYFQFKPHIESCTKRSILSNLARIFDPLGFLGPVLLYVKCLIKELWGLKLDWDDTPPPEFVRNWELFTTQIPVFSNLAIPRHMGASETSKIWLVGFCDGSNKGYGAVVYFLRQEENGDVSSSLMCSKSRVTPLKSSLTIPRIELCSACLLAKLLQSVKDSLSGRIDIERIIAFTDSTITLHRIKSNSLQDKDIFVRNRILKIKEHIPPNCWFHVASSDNPADCLSRGLLPQKLLEHALWWSGPAWLIEEFVYWPCTASSEEKEDTTQELCYSCVQEETPEHPLLSLATRCSSWNKLLNATVFVLRFIRKLPNLKLPVNASDLIIAEKYVLAALQRKHFYEEIKSIQNNENCSRQIQKYSPFIDNNNLLRVGGRLKYSDLNFDQKHPILLPKNSYITELIIRHYHEKNLHTGSHMLMSILKSKYWILSARSVVRKITRNCNICFKAKPKHYAPMMADLPANRVCASTAFSHTGVDYAGPVYITLKRGRGQRSIKSYVCLFVCFSTKALHIEVAPDLTTESFLNAFKRFLARRGICDVLYSDRGTNFVGAKSTLSEIYKFLDSSDFKSAFQAELAEHRIQWKFNPPSCPHFGGLWESNVKAVKSHLFKTIGKQILSLDEFNTVLVQIEGILNSRPLTVLSDDPTDLQSLTPAHFLVGRPLTMLPSLDVSNENENRLTRPALLDSIVQRFWKRWHLEYLHSLQARSKWNVSQPTINPGAVVLIIDEHSPPYVWLLGKIEEVFPGKDGIVRVASVRIKNGVYTRPIVKLCPLPTQ